MSRYDAVFFDMGNTLLDFHTEQMSDEGKDSLGNKLLLEKLRSEYGIELTEEEYFREFWDPFISYMKKGRDKLLKEYDIEAASRDL